MILDLGLTQSQQPGKRGCRTPISEKLKGKMLKKLFGFSFLVVIFHLSVGLQAATFNVTTPAEFQTALTKAQANGEVDTINVAPGTYNVGSTLTYDTNENFALTIIGAGAAVTTLDGGNSVQLMHINGNGTGHVSVRGLTFQHGRATTGIPAGGGLGGALVITNGQSGSVTVDNCVIDSNTSTTSAGGCYIGMLNGDASITNSSITNNSCDEGTADDGGGLYIYFDTGGTGDAVVRNCNISNNKLGDNLTPIGGCDGAGLMIYHMGSGATFTIENNSFNNNLSHYGTAGAFLRNPGQTTMVITGNICSGNTTGGNPQETEIAGSGMLVYTDGGSITINNNQFLDNVSLGIYDYGAGLAVANLPQGILEMIGNVFADNRTNANGGGATVNLGSGMSKATIIENLFVNNQANTVGGSGGGLSLSAQSDVTLINNTFYGNAAADGGGLGFYAEDGGDSATLQNEIYSSNTPNSLSVFGAGPVAAQYCNIEGGTGESWFGTGCIDSNPAFFNTTSPQGADGIYATIDDGLHLTDGSPSGNTGNNTFVPGTVTTDIAGKNRIQDTTVDMGAYEGPEGSFVDLDILANGQNGPVIVTPADTISIEISLNPGDYAGRTADMWIAVKTPFEPPGDWYSYVYPGGWKPGIHPCIQIPLFDLSPLEVLLITLPLGDYTFYFAIDDPDGSPLGPWWEIDSVDVHVE